MKRIFFTLCAIGVLFTACGQSPLPEQLPDTSVADSIQDTIVEEEYVIPDSVDLKQQIAQMLIVGFRGTQLKKTDHIVRDITKYKIGGVILFEFDAPSKSRPRNITSREQVKKLCSDLQALTPETLFISIDQEGGYVSRLLPKYGFPKFAKAADQGAIPQDSNDRNKLTIETARMTAEALRDVGINLNFAPVVDVNVNPNCPIIGRIARSFSSDPARVSECAEIWIDEQNKQHVLSCLKHFPGHGSSKDDTHEDFADVTKTWSEAELEPYRTLIKTNKVQLIMTTHVVNRQLDKKYPATLSKYTLTTLLRDSLGYQGAIITDDLTMGAVSKHYNLKTLLELSINAGADILCVSNNGSNYRENIVPRLIDLIYSLVQEGKIDEQRIHDSYIRIQKLKKSIQ
ncbi:MAG: hypothetical protein MJZ62_06090 [Bacteroidales bacterium]|nr:hypothetical protein [Bacteroidales bacterium]